ncbi:ABC transporter permease [Deinococcus sp. KSM4-11]|uniref:ABC transporter permease n=1 Tax=Deinococcus sp. KSM4-11 TaxID=2568654 RepID=UPI0010A57E4E|nr:ABC transporter permease [Deinococcus sp. KSM4-11]THF86983.1 ABC transporter permease [Deinococcus sp. KSM4-11]
MSGPTTGTPSPGVPRARPTAPGFLGDLRQVRASVLILLALLVFNALFTPHFLTVQALNVNLTQVATIIIVAMGMTLVIATGGVDLSVGSLMAISGVLAPLIFLSGAFANAPTLGLILSFIVPVLVTLGFGMLNGVFVTRLRLQPIVATLVLYIAGRGLAQVITNGQLQSFTNDGFSYLGLGRPLGVPFQVYVMLLVVAVTYWVVKRTVFGRSVLATGGNAAAARLAGVPVGRVTVQVYAISGLLAGIAGLIVVAINRSSDANQVGQGMELDAIAAVAVGGTLLSGGRAQVLGTFLGALIIQLIRFTLLTRGVPDAGAMVVKAAVIVAAVALQQRRRRE